MIIDRRNYYVKRLLKYPCNDIFFLEADTILLRRIFVFFPKKIEK